MKIAHCIVWAPCFNVGTKVLTVDSMKILHHPSVFQLFENSGTILKTHFECV